MNIRLGVSFLVAVIARAFARPALESVGKGKGVHIADVTGDGLDLVTRGAQQGSRPAHAQVGDLLDGAAAKLLLAQAAQVLLTQVANFGQVPEFPVAAQIAFHCLPDAPEAIVVLEGQGSPGNVCMNELDPVVQKGRMGISLRLDARSELRSTTARIREAAATPHQRTAAPAQAT